MSKKEKVRGCSRAVRDLPLDRFRLPMDGRKWRVLARQRRALLLDISAYANGDGTFVRTVEGRSEPINYSPSAERLLKHWAYGSLYRYQNDLRLLDLLDWDRPNRQHRRTYLITAHWPYPFRPEHLQDWKEKHVPGSKKKGSKKKDLHDSLDSDLHHSNPDLRDSQPDLRDSNPDLQQLEGTSVSSLIPSLPSNTRPPYPPLQKQQQGDSKDEQLFQWHGEVLAIQIGRRKRLPNLDKYAGHSAQDVCDFLLTRGFPARVVTETTIVPDDHIPHLDVESRWERNLRAAGLPPDTFRPKN